MVDFEVTLTLTLYTCLCASIFRLILTDRNASDGDVALVVDIGRLLWRRLCQRTAHHPVLDYDDDDNESGLLSFVRDEWSALMAPLLHARRTQSAPHTAASRAALADVSVVLPNKL